MSSSTVIDAVMAEFAKDVAATPTLAGFSWDKGHDAAAQNLPAPRVVWVPLRGTLHAPQQAGDNPRPIANRRTVWSVLCRGRSIDEAEALLELVVRAMHRTLTRGGYSADTEEWDEVGATSASVTVALGVTLGIPVLDRTQPSTRPTSVTTNGTITP